MAKKGNILKTTRDFFTVEEVAEKEKTTTKTVYGWIESGYITPVDYLNREKKSGPMIMKPYTINKRGYKKTVKKKKRERKTKIPVS